METLRVKKLNFFESIIGLIGKTHPEPVLIQTRFGIHTFGLKFPIDVLVLDKQKEENIYKVIQIKRSLPPNHLFFWNPKYKTIVELPNKYLKDKELKPKEFLYISF